MSSKHHEDQSQKQHNAGIISTAYVLIITLSRKKSITTATRPVQEIAQWKNYYFYLTKQRKSAREIKKAI
jgi:hypothetical protein